MASRFSAFSLRCSDKSCFPTTQRNRPGDWPIPFLKRPMANIGYLICMIVLSGVPFEASALMYKCMTEGGVYSFQDAPCEAPVHDKTKDPVAGTVTPLPTIEIDSEELAYRMRDRPDTVQTNDSKVKDAILIVVALILYLGLAAFQGWWASMRNRSFWRWFLFAALINPLLVMLIFRFRGKDPAPQKQVR